MKTRKTLILFFTILISNQFIYSQNLIDKGISIEKDGDSYLIHFQLPDYKVLAQEIKKSETEKEAFSFIKVPDYGIIYEEGKPQLPQITLNFAIPYDETEIPKHEIIERSTKNIKITNKIYPSQYSYPTTTKSTIKEFKVLPSVYESNKTIYSELIKISDSFIISGVKGISVTIIPFAYNPDKNKLEVTTEATIRIRTKTRVSTKVAKSKALDQYLNNQFVNSSDFENTSASNITLLKSASVENTKGKLLMLVPWKYDDIAFRYFLHKKAQGYDVIYYRYLGYDYGMTWTSPEDMKAIIQSAYDNIDTRPEYVLLIGNFDDIGTWEYDIDDVILPSDLGYTQLDGSDVLADVAFGRWPVSNNTELENIVNKSIEMDNKFIAHDISPKNAVVISDYDADFWYDLIYPNYEESSNSMATNLENDGYSCEKIYENSGGTTNDIIDAFNDEAYIVTYRGHGSTNRWVGPEFSVSSSNNHHLSLSNSIYPIIFSIACHTANFTVSNNLGVEMVNSPNGGVAFLGGTEVTPREANAFFCNEIFRDSYPVLDNVGKIIDDAKAQLATTIYIPPSDIERKKRLIAAYNFLGDPSIQIRYNGADDYVITGGEVDINETVVYPVAENIEVGGVGSDYGEPTAIEYTVRGNGSTGANMTIEATNSITLNPGFKVEKGAVFSASIVSATASNLKSSQLENNDLSDFDLKQTVINEDDNHLLDIKVYPNPFTEQLNFHFQLDSKSKVIISIFNINGLLIKQLVQPTEYVEGIHVISSNLSELNNGIYIYKVNINNNMYYSKILKN